MSKSQKSRAENRILFGLSGSIACYKASFLISDLVQSGYELQVVATNKALKFIGNSTLEGLTSRPVLTDLYQESRQMDHIHLVRNTDLFVICPATATFINKVFAGIADDLLSACFIANNFKTRCLIVPAMNVEMFNYPATQRSLQGLKEWGTHILIGKQGPLACGEDGFGRMAEIEDIKTQIINML